MRRTIVIALSLILCAGASAAGDRALLIGIGRYQIEKANLPGVEEDLTMMREVARTLGFAEEQIKVLADSEATLAGIRDAVSDWLVAGTSAGDRALFYHSGHGSRIPDASGDENDGSDEVLLPFDFQEIAGDGETRLRNVLLDDELGRLLDRIPAREVVALVDSCHSGTMTRSLGGRWRSKFYGYSGLPRGAESSIGDRSFRRRDSIVLLSAARPEEDAQTSEHGALFTQGVWRAVRQAAPRRRLTLEELRSATERHIRQEVGQRHSLFHRPMLTGEPVLRSINLFLPAAGTPAAGTPTGTSDLWRQLENLVEDAGHKLEVKAGKAIYGVGESLDLSVVAAGDGYLHIFNVGEREDELILLYPNRYQTDHQVRRGETVHIPAPDAFTLPASLPTGQERQRNLVVAIQTPAPLFADARTPADPEELLRVVRRGEPTRSIGRSRPAYAAGRVVVTIEP